MKNKKDSKRPPKKVKTILNFQLQEIHIDKVFKQDEKLKDDVPENSQLIIKK